MIDIKERVTGKILVSSKEKTIKEAVIEAVTNNIELRGADLRGANLGGANLRRIKITDKEKEQIVKALQWEITNDNEQRDI